MLLLRLMIITGLLSLPLFVRAQAPSAVQKSAEVTGDTAAATKRIADEMKDAKRREGLLDTDQAKQAHKNLQNLTGDGANLDKSYDLAAKLFEKLMAEAKGDPNKASQLLLEYQKNPEAFYEKLSSADKAKIRDIANDANAGPASTKGP